MPPKLPLHPPAGRRLRLSIRGVPVGSAPPRSETLALYACGDFCPWDHAPRMRTNGRGHQRLLGKAEVFPERGCPAEARLGLGRTGSADQFANNPLQLRLHVPQDAFFSAMALLALFFRLFLMTSFSSPIAPDMFGNGTRPKGTGNRNRRASINNRAFVSCLIARKASSMETIIV